MGGIAGALLIALLLVCLLRRRYRRQGQWRESARRVGVIDEDEGDSEYPAGAVRPNERLENYRLTPLVLDGESGSLRTSGGLPGGAYMPLETVHDSSAGESSSGQGGDKRHKGALSATRVVNYVLHDDAGPSVPALELETMIEMPPAYADLRRDKAEEGNP